MGYSFSIKTTLVLLLSLLLLLNRNLVFSLAQPQFSTTLAYNNGPILTGNLSITIVWYGRFTPVQRSILLDFLSSLNPTPTSLNPSVSSWWKTLETYSSLIPHNTFTTTPRVIKVLNQKFYESWQLGRVMTRSQIQSLAQKSAKEGDVVMVFTDETVAVEGFCMGGCARHGSLEATRAVYLWVGNSVTQCPGQCAWPFHQPIYGPQTAPMVAPNGDVGVDGMVIGLASALAAAVTNPYGSGFFQGDAAAPLEAASACAGAYGRGAYPGYAGEVMVDAATGGCYNAHGVHGRKFLLPALWDPLTSCCFTLGV